MKPQTESTLTLELLDVLTDDGIHRMNLDSITHLSSSGAYTLISYQEREDVLHVGKNLGRFEEALASFGFFRIHKGHMVNMKRIEHYRGTKAGGQVELTDGTVLPVSRLRKSYFLKAFKTMATVTV